MRTYTDEEVLEGAKEFLKRFQSIYGKRSWSVPILENMESYQHAHPEFWEDLVLSGKKPTAEDIRLIVDRIKSAKMSINKTEILRNSVPFGEYIFKRPAQQEARTATEKVLTNPKVSTALKAGGALAVAGTLGYFWVKNLKDTWDR